MGARLQLFRRKLSGCMGCAVLFLILFAPGIVIAYISQSLIWAIAGPVATIVALILLSKVARIFNPNRGKRNITPEQFANELERHLLGTEGPWDWDDVTSSVSILDERLERIRWELSKFDSLSQERDKEELKALIAALRRGEIPEVVPPTFLTYR